MFITKKKHEEAIVALRDEFGRALVAAAAGLQETARRELAEARAEDAATAAELRAADEAAIAAIRAEIEAGMQTLREEYQQVFEKALEAHRKARYESEEPFVEIISENFSSDNGVGLRLDWNNAFIKYLKANGFNGVSDEAIVDSWIVSLSRERLAEGEFRG